VYAHGFNVPEDKSRAEIAEMFKRLWQSGSRAMFTGVSWYGSQKTLWLVGSLDYHVNVRNAFLTAPSLKTAVDLLPGTSKFICGHSLGNMLISSAIVDHQLSVDSYFAIDAAVAMEAYDGNAYDSNMINPKKSLTFHAWKDYETRLWASEWYRLFPNADGRSRLTWRNRFGAIPNFYNFFSSGEEVLKDSPSDKIAEGEYPALGTDFAWVTQEIRKGTPVFDLLHFFTFVNENAEGGWGFHDAFSPSPSQATATEFPDDVLRQNPFFKHFNDTRLTDPSEGSAVANDPAVRAQLLAAAIPALSRAQGANRSEQFDGPSGDRNFNLSSPIFQTDWPQKRQNTRDIETRWLHSDLKDIAYPFNHRLHDTITDFGGLQN
jgi:hypothetical protein